MAQQERVRKGKSWGKEKKKKGKEGKSGLREKSIFLLLCDRVFHFVIFSPFQSTMPPLFFLRSHTHTPQSTSHHRTHTTQHMHAFVLPSLCVTVSALNPHSINQHNTMQSCNTHTWGQPMDDAMSEWERAVVIEDTTPQTPSTTMK